MSARTRGTSLAAMLERWPLLRSSLVLVAIAAVAGAVQQLAAPVERAWRSAHAAPAKSPARARGEATFTEAAELLRAGRHAEAYGRFVELAEDGDVDAARIALVMHRFGPSVYGSAWDASVDQIARWTRTSEAAAEKDLAHLRPTAPRRCDDAPTVR